MSMTATTATKHGHRPLPLRQCLHGLAWATAIVSVWQGFCHLTTPRVVVTKAPSGPARIQVVPMLPSSSVSGLLPGVWRWRFHLLHQGEAVPRMQLHTWQARGGRRLDNRVTVPINFADSEIVDVTLSPGPSREELGYRGDPAGQLYVCDTLKLQVTPCGKGIATQTVYVANPFQAAQQFGTATESLPAIVVKDGPRTSVDSASVNDQAGQSVDLAVTARPGWGVTGAATLEFDAFEK